MKPIDLDKRRRGIGGTDISAILGVNPYRSAWDVWLDKRGELDDEEFVETPAMHWGTKLEATIAEEFASRHPELGEMMLNKETIQHAIIPEVIGTPDALFRDTAVGLEIKTAGRNDGVWGSTDGPNVPTQYYLQCVWYMAVMDWDTWWLAVLIGGQDYREYYITRDVAVEDKVIAIARDFWRDNVVGGEMPEVDDSPAIRAWVDRKYNAVDDVLVDANEEDERVFDELLEVRKQQKNLAQKETLLKNKMYLRIGGASGISFADGSVITWKRSRPSKKTDWKAVAKEADVPDEIVKRHTKVVDGSRRFLVKAAEQRKGDEDNE